MSIERYCHTRIVVLEPSRSAHEAARAMIDNGIGTVLVADPTSVAGIVTDRDLAHRVVAANRDPRATLLAEILSEPLCSVTPRTSVDQVIELMIAEGYRRLPIIDGSKIVGMVTLDDLLLDGVIDSTTAARVIRSQLARPARLKAPGAVHPQRHSTHDSRPAHALARTKARASTSYTALLRKIHERTGLAGIERCELALGIVAESICRRVTPDEAKRFIAQLPSVLSQELAKHLDGPHRFIGRDSIETELAGALSMRRARAALVLADIAAVLTEAISDGQAHSLRSQLPRDLEELFRRRDPPIELGF
jgi:CBS domain-containing protein/uncharacterized protein (DUF2267 family)